jgi:hypothetical protein
MSWFFSESWFFRLTYINQKVGIRLEEPNQTEPTGFYLIKKLVFLNVFPKKKRVLKNQVWQ